MKKIKNELLFCGNEMLNVNVKLIFQMETSI